MKIPHILAILALTLITSVTTHATTFFYPSQTDAWFSIEIPEAWHPKVDDETLEATAPKDAAYLAFWVLKNKSDFKDLDKDIDDILKDSVVDAKIGPQSTKTINGIEFLIFEGKGKDRKEKTPVSFEVWMFAPKPGKVGVLYVDYDSDASEELVKNLVNVVTSIKINK